MTVGERITLALYAAGMFCLLIAAYLVSWTALIATAGGLFVFIAAKVDPE